MSTKPREQTDVLACIYKPTRLTANQSLNAWESIVKCNSEAIIASNSADADDDSRPSIFDWSKYDHGKTGSIFQHVPAYVSEPNQFYFLPCRWNPFTHFIQLLWPLCYRGYEICTGIGRRLPQVGSSQIFRTWCTGEDVIGKIFQQSGYLRTVFL